MIESASMNPCGKWLVGFSLIHFREGLITAKPEGEKEIRGFLLFKDRAAAVTWDL